MADADGLTHTLTGANQCLPLIFTFKSALKATQQVCAKETMKLGRSEMNERTISRCQTPSFKNLTAPLAFPLGRMEMPTLGKCQTTFYLLGLEQEGGQKSGESKINRNSTCVTDPLKWTC